MHKAGVYITISSYSHGGGSGHFEMNWFGIPQKYLGKSVAVLTAKEKPFYITDLLAYCIVERPTDRYTTSVLAPHFNISTLMKGECLGYWIFLVTESGRPGEPNFTYSSCFTPMPRWMRQHCCKLAPLKLKKLLIPGTHNSGMYSKGHVWPHEEYIYNQDQNITTQLAYGIRSLDLRVMYYGNVFYVSHGNWRGWPTIRQVLLEVRQFVKKTGELVLLDFHAFNEGFEPPATERHKQLVRVIVEELEEVLLNGTFFQKSLGEILDYCENKTEKPGHVFVFYNAHYEGWGEEYLLSAVFHRWPDAQSVPELLEYLKKEGCSRLLGYSLISAMAEMTPKFPYLIIGARHAAQMVNHDITELFRTNISHCHAIVATDFFRGNDIIRVAIEANLNRVEDESVDYSYSSLKDCNISRQHS
ncbi:uncharacterized protein LOC144137691 [Haemaphysalis longicornis]